MPNNNFIREKKKLYFYIGNSGFGNKIFNIIIALYIKNIHNCDVYTMYDKGIHNKNKDPTIMDIYPKILDNINILNNLYMHKKNNILKINIGTFKSLIDFQNIFNKNNKIYITKLTKSYKYINEIYNKLNKNIKNIFNVNMKLIKPNIKKIAKTKYICIHIRYGDKLNYLKNKKNTNNIFLVYTPEYYIQTIEKLSKYKIPIYIVTDSNNIVKEFIMKNIKYKNIKILDIPYWNAFYILYNSNILVMSHSSFSIASKIISKKIIKSIIIKKSKLNKRLIGEDYIILSKNFKKNVKVINNKKYILNNDIKLAKKMIKYL
tara:strand:+ start:766 stop:1719 length:954 start_codon:yes stop_codon:yes gene_type:complete